MIGQLNAGLPNRFSSMPQQQAKNSKQDLSIYLIANKFHTASTNGRIFTSPKPHAHHFGDVFYSLLPNAYLPATMPPPTDLAVTLNYGENSSVTS